jgi:ATP-dependent exoDNAse (exonuclease V) alpha subunit
MRYDVNKFIRQNILGFSSRSPHIGERIICRRNNWMLTCNGFALTNGLSGIIEDIHRRPMKGGGLAIDFRPDIFKDFGFDDVFMDLIIDFKHLTNESYEDTDSKFNKLEKFEYAYAITVHLSQGSEYPRVLFLDQGFPDPRLTKRARYTAITRASEAITIVHKPQNIIGL